MASQPALSLNHPDTLSPGPAFDAATPVGTDVIDDSLATISELYEYNHWIYSLLRPHVAGRVMEVGCGTGNITRFLSMSATEVVGIDPVEQFVQSFNQRFSHASHVKAMHADLQSLPRPTHDAETFDTVVSSNVLEHIEDDREMVALMADQLRPGGKVVAFVPAGPAALGRLDRELGHYRRYTKRSLKNVFQDAGLEWVSGRYSNTIGLLGWWFNSVVLRRRLVPAKQAVSFNRIVPLLSALERVVTPPFGQSVIGVGRKPS